MANYIDDHNESATGVGSLVSPSRENKGLSKKGKHKLN